MNLLALDLSLTSTGWAAKHGADPVTSGTYCPKSKGVERLADAVRWLDVMLFTGHRADLVVLEGYSFASRTAHAHAAGELGGVIRLRLYATEVPFVEIPPACRAKLATGKGNASKELVLVEAVKRLGFAGHSNDEADARWLIEAALHHYGLPGAVPLPQTHIDALAKVTWPAPPLARAS